MASDYQRIEQVIRYVETHAAEQPGLDAIAAHVGLSGPYLQRVFKRWVGLSRPMAEDRFAAAAIRSLFVGVRPSAASTCRPLWFGRLPRRDPEWPGTLSFPLFATAPCSVASAERHRRRPVNPLGSAVDVKGGGGRDVRAKART